MKDYPTAEQTTEKFYGLSTQLFKLVDAIRRDRDELKFNLTGEWTHQFFCPTEYIQEVASAVEQIDDRDIYAVEALAEKLEKVFYLLKDALCYTRESPPHRCEE